jgi:hypothetical protein
VSHRLVSQCRLKPQDQFALVDIEECVCRAPENLREGEHRRETCRAHFAMRADCAAAEIAIPYLDSEDVGASHVADANGPPFGTVMKERGKRS